MTLEMKRTEGTGKVLCGMSYHKYSGGTTYVDGLSREDIKDAAAGYCVLLPYREESKTKFECLYRAVFSDWDVIDSSGEKKLSGTLPERI
jgi:hypothetical protein